MSYIRARRRARGVAVLLLLTLIVQPFTAAAVYADAPEVDAKAYIVIDADTGEILYEKNSADVLVPASMTKLMTLYVTLDQIAQRRLAWTDEAVISDYSNLISRTPSLTSFELREGAAYTVEELFYAAAINSSNAAAIALAERIGGTEGAFVDMMNAKARDFGLTDTKFVNSSGLNNGDLAGHHAEGTEPREDTKLSARSMATIAYRLVNDYPQYMEFSSLRQKRIREGRDDQLTINTTNRMLRDPDYSMDGLRGLKTGYTANAGNCFAGYAVRDSGRFISVVMGAPSSEERFRGSARLLEYGFDLAEGQESRPLEQAHVYLYPDSLNYHTDTARGGLHTYGDTGFGVMGNGAADVLALNGDLYCVSKRGHVSRLDDASGVGLAAMTFMSRDGEVELPWERDLAGLEEALLQAVDDTENTSYYFKIEGDVKPERISSVSNPEAVFEAPAGSGAGTVIGVWNHAADNAALRHGFTFYYLDGNRRSGGVLVDAELSDLSVRIDRLEPIGAMYDRGEEFAIETE